MLILLVREPYPDNSCFGTRPHLPLSIESDDNAVTTTEQSLGLVQESPGTFLLQAQPVVGGVSVKRKWPHYILFSLFSIEFLDAAQPHWFMHCIPQQA